MPVSRQRLLELARIRTRGWLEEETGTVHKSWRGRISVGLIYPNTYPVGMSNLGFQTVYRLFNEHDHIVCERFFLPPQDEQGPLVSVESSRPLSRFDVVAFSLSFENDFPNILSILLKAGIPFRAAQRGDTHPLIIAGGVAAFLNPEPIAPFVDCFLIGEAEAMLPQFLGLLDPAEPRDEFLLKASRDIPGVYVPAFYETIYGSDGALEAFLPKKDVPARVRRRRVPDLSVHPTCTTLVTKHTTFDAPFLMEVGRGCPHGCRFCSGGFVYRPARFRTLDALCKCLEQGMVHSERIGLLGSAVSNLPDLDGLCRYARDRAIKLSFSSLRADAMTDRLIETLGQSKVRTATLAPDAGSERMRRVINKSITQKQVIEAAGRLVTGGVPNMKLYFMVGLPTETLDDVDAIVSLTRKVKHRFLKSSRPRGRMGHIHVSLNSFVPKPFTPFQWVAMDSVTSLKSKIRRVKKGLKRLPNVTVHGDMPRWAFIQALLSRGDRRVAPLLEKAAVDGGTWTRILKESPLNAGFYVSRQRGDDELFPWDFIDHGVRKSFLLAEFRKALHGEMTDPCRIGTCTVCGACGEETSL
ncbi:radical SAM protein [Thermodesulfobacteriota bacterium]